MVTEVRPLGVKCNITCHYCYQNPLRDNAPKAKAYDLGAMKAAILAKGAPFALFGGEPLLIPKPDLEDLFAFGLENFKSNSIQTNGVLLDAGHAAIFKKYNVQVGLSLDGPGELNAPRWAGSDARTAAATEKVEAAIRLLLGHGLTPSLITTLHRHNATGSRLDELLDWFVRLDAQGIRNARIHMLEIETGAVRSALALTAPENVAALRALASLERTRLTRLRFDIFAEIDTLLMASDHAVSCIWRACDPYTTEAVQGIEGQGESSNCGRTAKSGVDFLKAESAGFERYLALYHTPQAFGGCAGCRFFLVCKGQCPGTSIDGDWRNRTEQCETWFALFAEAEARLVTQGRTPISSDPNLRDLEHAMLAQWARGENPPLWWVLDQMRVQHEAAPAKQAAQ